MALLTLPPGTRIAVGLSGGVDSAMAAALLKEQGCDVVGVTMSVWDGSVPLPDRGISGCYGPGESRDLVQAAAISERLGIPHKIIPLASAFRTHVLDYARAEYRAGRTPNPCAQCNRLLKFGLLPEHVRRAGISFDRFATGHYVRAIPDAKDGTPRLFRGRDPSKDQSYFLARLTREQLASLVFPLGEKTKEEVRGLARARGFGDLADQAESQDFLEAKGVGALFADDPPEPGEVVDESGRVLGRHNGLVHYTVGQRKGLGIGGAGEPYYVISLDAERNRVVVGRRDALFRSSFRAHDCSWLAWEHSPTQPFRAEVCHRLRTRPAPAHISPDPETPGCVRIAYDEPRSAISPGQIAAFYKGDQVLGAGIIGIDH